MDRGAYAVAANGVTVSSTIVLRSPEQMAGVEDPLVSIITVCQNASDTIRDTILSVASQDYERVEHIIVDGASRDGTKEIISSLRDHVDVLVSEPDEGLYDALNKGIAMARGAVVGILNADDVYEDETSLRRLVRGLQNADADAVFADLVVTKRHDTRSVLRRYSSRYFAPGRLRFGWMPAHPTLLVRRDVLDEVGLYSLDYEIAADYEMVIRLFAVRRASYSYLPRVVVRMRSGGTSSSSWRRRLLLNQEIVRACRSHGISTSLPLVLAKAPLKMLEYVFKRQDEEDARA